MEGVGNIADHIGVDETCSMPSPRTSSEDCRINCTDSQSLRSILDITLGQISELAESYSSNDDRSELITQFSDTFKTALQENILINGLPFTADKSSKLTSPEKEDHMHLVDDALFSKLSKTVANVAHKRKFCPEQCSRILNIQMKHDLQNLKKAEVVDSSTSSVSSPDKDSSSYHKSKNLARFGKSCKTFNTVQETVEYMLPQREKLVMKISLASDIKEQQRIHLKSSSDNVDIALKKDLTVNNHSFG